MWGAVGNTEFCFLLGGHFLPHINYRASIRGANQTKDILTPHVEIAVRKTDGKQHDADGGCVGSLSSSTSNERTARQTSVLDELECVLAANEIFYRCIATVTTRS